MAINTYREGKGTYRLKQDINPSYPLFLSSRYWLPESPRWLLAQGRLEELSRLVERAAKINGTTLPSNYQKTLEAAVPMTPQQQLQQEKDSRTDQTQPPPEDEATRTSTAVEEARTHEPLEVHVNPFLVVFGSKYWRTTVLTLLIWFTLIIIYFGLTLHLSNLGGNIYVNSAVAGTLESISIGISIAVVLKAGISRSLLGYMLLAGISCLAINLVPQGENNETGVIALATIGTLPLCSLTPICAQSLLYLFTHSQVPDWSQQRHHSHLHGHAVSNHRAQLWRRHGQPGFGHRSDSGAFPLAAGKKGSDNALSKSLQIRYFSF